MGRATECMDMPQSRHLDVADALVALRHN
jgi:hypothetical protein